MNRKEWSYVLGSLAVAIWMITEELSTGLFVSSLKQRITSDSSAFQLIVLVLSTVSAACGMEYYARYSHRDSWHNSKSLFCKVHLTHHQGKSNEDAFETNDFLGIFNFFVVIGPLIWSLRAPPSFGTMALLGLCIGISLFGTCYMIVHDGVHHRRFPVFGFDKIPYIRRVADAHAQHHSSKMGAPFGLFLGPQELEAHAAGAAPTPMPSFLSTSLMLCTAVAATGLVFGF
jgi:beta-carotene 3-hydroxylase